VPNPVGSTLKPTNRPARLSHENYEIGKPVHMIVSIYDGPAENLLVTFESSNYSDIEKAKSLNAAVSGECGGSCALRDCHCPTICSALNDRKRLANPLHQGHVGIALTPRTQRGWSLLDPVWGVRKRSGLKSIAARAHSAFSQHPPRAPVGRIAGSSRCERPRTWAAARPFKLSSAGGPRPAIENPCVRSLTRTGHGPGCRAGLWNSYPRTPGLRFARSG